MERVCVSLFGTVGVANAIMFILTVQISEITPEHVFLSPNGQLQEENKTKQIG